MGATRSLSVQGTTIGPWLLAPVRSPRAMTASTGPGTLRASAVAPAAPADPLVDASTIERLCVCPASTRASSSSTPVPDSSAGSSGATASRCETTTIVPLDMPARSAITLRSVRGPSTVCARKVCVETE